MQSPFANVAYTGDEYCEPFVEERVRMLLTHVPDEDGREIIKVNLCVADLTTRQYSFVTALTRPARIGKTASSAAAHTYCDHPIPPRNTSATPSVRLDPPRKSVCVRGTRFHPVKCVLQYPIGAFVPRTSMKYRLDLI